jgi:hypothetical protein
MIGTAFANPDHIGGIYLYLGHFSMNATVPKRMFLFNR